MGRFSTTGLDLIYLLYADDLLLISSSAEGLQPSLNRLSKYCQSNHILKGK